MSYCFTLQNYTDEEYTNLLGADAQYVIIGKEVEPSTGTPHLQGFIKFKSARGLKALEKLNERVKWIAADTRECQKNITFCTKQGRHEERGSRPQKTKKEEKIETFRASVRAAQEGRFDDIPSDLYVRNKKLYELIYSYSLNGYSSIEEKRANGGR